MTARRSAESSRLDYAELMGDRAALSWNDFDLEVAGDPDPIYFWFEADLHSGHRLGLADPATVLFDDDDRAYGLPILETQRYMWELREQYIAQALKITAGAPFAYIVVGDITHGKKYPTGLLSTCIADQFAIAAANIERIAAEPNCAVVRLISGTASHTFGEATSERGVAALLRAKFPDKDIRVLGHSKISLPGDQLLDIAHHGPGAGIRQWTRGNVARYYLRSLVWQDFKAGRAVPSLVVRAHYHTWVHEMLDEWFAGRIVSSHLIVMPSWCGMTEFGRQATASQFEVFNGIVLAELRYGRISIYPLVRSLDIRVEDTNLVDSLARAAAK